MRIHDGKVLHRDLKSANLFLTRGKGHGKGEANSASASSNGGGGDAGADDDGRGSGDNGDDDDMARFAGLVDDDSVCLKVGDFGVAKSLASTLVSFFCFAFLFVSFCLLNVYYSIATSCSIEFPSLFANQ
jgi:serine/threonine protein kinase